MHGQRFGEVGCTCCRGAAAAMAGLEVMYRNDICLGIQIRFRRVS